eukprot:jgi/Undpi1/10717/HiC_scaffold_29.g13165.m1
MGSGGSSVGPVEGNVGAGHEGSSSGLTAGSVAWMVVEGSMKEMLLKPILNRRVTVSRLVACAGCAWVACDGFDEEVLTGAAGQREDKHLVGAVACGRRPKL